ncbi:MAG TPA: SAM-dependent methyltransferase, partial [Clostridia bacterium]
EHGLSPDKNIAFKQNCFNPFYRLFSEGCNLNRNIKNIVEENNFKIIQLDQFYLDHVLKPAGYLYKGIALKM